MPCETTRLSVSIFKLLLLILIFEKALRDKMLQKFCCQRVAFVFQILLSSPISPWYHYRETGSSEICVAKGNGFFTLRPIRWTFIALMNWAFFFFPIVRCPCHQTSYDHLDGSLKWVRILRPVIATSILGFLGSSSLFLQFFPSRWPRLINRSISSLS